MDTTTETLTQQLRRHVDRAAVRHWAVLASLPFDDEECYLKHIVDLENTHREWKSAFGRYVEQLRKDAEAAR